MSIFWKIDLDILDVALRRNRELRWLLEANSMPKLRTFVMLYSVDTARDIIKSDLPRAHRSVLTKLKIGVLPLHLETGRWKGTPLKYRLCMDPSGISRRYIKVVTTTCIQITLMTAQP